jgi:tRNA(fMet)-specific endonuclease VapC
LRTFDLTDVGAMGMLIGAHAQSIPVSLVTNSLREFKKIPHLKLENWVR